MKDTEIKESIFLPQTLKCGFKMVQKWENLYGEDVYRIFREATVVETRIPQFA